MSFKDKFSEDEWETLQLSVIWMFQAIAGADKNIDEKELHALTTLMNKAQKFEFIFLKELLSSLRFNINEISDIYAIDQRSIKTGLRELAESEKSEQISGLETIFKPLHNSQSSVYTLNLSKAKATWLRIYALRIEKNVYLITGGAIKLTLMMEVRNHTKEELRKMNRCRDYLLNQGIVDHDGLIDELEI